MRKLKLTLVVIASMFVFTANAQTVQEVQAKFKEAATLFNEKKFVEAIPLFEEVISMGDMAEGDVTDIVSKAQKSIYVANLNTGLQNARSGNFTEAIEFFKSAGNSTTNMLEKNKANNMITACYTNLTKKEMKAGNIGAAAIIADKRFTENPRDVKVGTLAAHCYANSGNIARSLEIYDTIIKLGETSPRYANDAKAAKDAAGKDMLSIAIDNIKAKDYVNALNNLNLASKYSENNPTIEMARIQVYNTTKEYAKVVEYGPKAVAAQVSADNKSNAAFFVAIAYQELAQKAKAIEFYKQVTTGANAETAKKLVAQLSKQE